MRASFQRSPTGGHKRTATGGLLTPNDDGSCCCGESCQDNWGSGSAPWPCPGGAPSTLTATFSGIDVFSDADNSTAVLGGQAYPILETIDFNVTATLHAQPAEDEGECPTIYISDLIARGSYSDDDNPVPVDVDYYAVADFLPSGFVGLNISGAAGSGFVGNIATFSGSDTRTVKCDRVGPYSFATSFTDSFPFFDGGDLIAAHNGSATLAA